MSFLLNNNNNNSSSSSSKVNYNHKYNNRLSLVTTFNPQGIHNSPQNNSKRKKLLDNFFSPKNKVIFWIHIGLNKLNHTKKRKQKASI